MLNILSLCMDNSRSFALRRGRCIFRKMHYVFLRRSVPSNEISDISIIMILRGVYPQIHFLFNVRHMQEMLHSWRNELRVFEAVCPLEEISDRSIIVILSGVHPPDSFSFQWPVKDFGCIW